MGIGITTMGVLNLKFPFAPWTAGCGCGSYGEKTPYSFMVSAARLRPVADNLHLKHCMQLSTANTNLSMARAPSNNDSATQNTPEAAPACDCAVPVVQSAGAGFVSLEPTLRQEHGAALLSSEIRYRRLFEAARDGILILDAVTRKITDANPFMTELLGYPHAELLGKELWEIGLLRDEDASREAFRNLQKKTFIRYEDMPLQTKTGCRREVEFVSNVYEENGRSVIQCNIRDITERKRIELEQQNARLKETIADLEHLSYSMGHDMRAPLRSINSFSSFLMDEYGDKLDATAADYLRRIVSSAQRMEDLVRDVLTYSQVARHDPTAAPVDLDQLVAEIVRESPQVVSSQAKVEVLGPLGRLSGSRVLAAKCLSNLLNNAMKFVAPGTKPHCRIWTEQRNGEVRVCVQDNGIGIAPSQFERIWRIFERGLHTGNCGTGIGLSVVKRAAERMGGSTGLQSAPGQGSTFWFQLPQANGAQEEPSLLRVDQCRILAVDDSQDDLVLLKRAFRKAANITIAATVGNGEEAIAYFKGEAQFSDRMKYPTPHLVLLDLKMPILDGFGVLEWLRDSPQENCRVIVFTSSLDEKDRRHALALGAHSVAIKPTDPAGYLAFVRDLAESLNPSATSRAVGLHPIAEKQSLSERDP
jgi:PAS domain S-box-containing protein